MLKLSGILAGDGVPIHVYIEIHNLVTNCFSDDASYTVDRHTSGASIACITDRVAQWDVIYDAEFMTSLCSVYFSMNLSGLLYEV